MVTIKDSVYCSMGHQEQVRTENESMHVCVCACCYNFDLYVQVVYTVNKFLGRYFEPNWLSPVKFILDHLIAYKSSDM